MSAVEPVVGVVALRTFRVSMNGYLVPATQYSNEWATGAAIARCSRFHQAPADDCSCGLYSMNDVHQLRTQYHQARRLLAVVALEGQTIQGTKGGRSQAARVLDIWTAPRAVPDPQLQQLHHHLPGVRFHTDLDGMLSRYPELTVHPQPRRAALAAACRGTRARVARARVTANTAIWWAAATALLGGVLALLGTPRLPPGLWVELGSIVLVGLAVAAVAAEAPGQLLILAIRGGTMPLLLAPWRPVKHLFRAGGSVLAGGVIAAALTGHPINVGGVAVTLGWWLPLLLTETFLCALHRSTRPVSVPVLMGIRPRGHRAVRTGWEPAHHRGGGRTLRDPHPLRRHLLAPINIIPATGA